MIPSKMKLHLPDNDKPTDAIDIKIPEDKSKKGDVKKHCIACLRGYHLLYMVIALIVSSIFFGHTAINWDIGPSCVRTVNPDMKSTYTADMKTTTFDEDRKVSYAMYDNDNRIDNASYEGNLLRKWLYELDAANMKKNATPRNVNSNLAP